MLKISPYLNICANLRNECIVSWRGEDGKRILNTVRQVKGYLKSLFSTEGQELSSEKIKNIMKRVNDIKNKMKRVTGFTKLF